MMILSFLLQRRKESFDSPGKQVTVKTRVMAISTQKKLTGAVYVLPCAAILLLMMAYPVVQTFVFSLSNIELPGFKLSFAGMKNFTRAFTKPGFAMIVGNTIIWTIFSTLLRLLLGLGSALLMNASVRGIGVLRIIALLPWTVPLIVSANSWRWMMQSDFGVINETLSLLGLHQFDLTWLASSKTALSSILVASTWAGYPFVMMMLLSALQGLPKELYEAARIDGASRFRLFRHITLPGIRPVLFVVCALEFISAINAFDMIFIMTGGGPGGSTEVLGLFVYRLAFSNFDFGSASSVSVLLILIAMLGFGLYALAQARNRKKESTQ
jgi:ABC-type sugar transport system permease subunit